MRVYIYLFLCLASSTLAYSQDRLITIENDKIPGKVTAASGQLIRFFNRFTNRPDSIPTALVQEIRYNDDSLRVIVIPEAKRNQLTTVSPSEFMQAIDLNDYTLLLQSKMARYDLSFTTATNGKAVRLTSESKARLSAWIALVKAHPEFTFALTVHTDLIGSAALTQLTTENRANALSAFMQTKGIYPAKVSVTGRGASERLVDSPTLNRRIEFSCTAAKGISVLYAAPYIASKQPQSIRQVPASASLTAPVSTPAPVVQTYTPSQPVQLRERFPRRFSLSAYLEGLYTFQTLSQDWVDPDTGPGNLQGFGGGVYYTYYLKPRINLIAQLGYSSWAVRRRYINETQVVLFTNDQLLSRLSAQAGVRLYVKPSVYFQPMVGGQQLTWTSQNSDTHPYGVNKLVNNTFLPTIGSDIGYTVKRQKLLFDVAAQYYMIPNKAFVGVPQALHFFGLRLGIGYRPDK